MCAEGVDFLYRELGKPASLEQLFAALIARCRGNGYSTIKIYSFIDRHGGVKLQVCNFLFEEEYLKKSPYPGKLRLVHFGWTRKVPRYLRAEFARVSGLPIMRSRKQSEPHLSFGWMKQPYLSRDTILKHLVEWGNAYVASMQYHGTLARMSLEDLRNLASGRQDLAKIHPRHFESLVAELLRADGYDDVRLLSRHNAPGPDIIALCTGPSGQKQRYLVECKRWRSAVGLAVVRDVMYRVNTEMRVTGAIIVASSRFTRVAVEEAKSLHQWRLTLKDAQDVHKWVQRNAVAMHRQRISKSRANCLAAGTAGRLVLDIIRNHQPAPKIRMAARPCARCGGLEICGEAELDWVEPLYAFFHLCLSCLNARYSEVRAQSVVCPLCGVLLL